MIETLKHIFGVCHDHHAHLDLKDILIGGTMATAGLSYVYWSVKMWIKNRRK